LVRFATKLWDFMGMIMDENNPKMKDEKVISCKCSCNIIARMVKGAKIVAKMTKVDCK